MEECGVSALQLSREVKVSHVAVGNWLQGSKPRPDALKELADWFGCDVQYLLHGKGKAPEFLSGEVKEPRQIKRLSALVVAETGTEYAVNPWVAWSGQLRAAWKKDQARVELAVRAAWPKPMAEEIIAWLSEKK